ncbi:MAG: TetR/AcrR family transcriptional regulator [Desulfobacterales bacterium]|nr:TetR/AcrR family transcriptional regulator [Desulfobacterales bacterium]
MPKKTHLTIDDFLETALDMVREDGWKKLSITAVAKRLGCSTMPVYTHFENLETLKDGVIKRGWELVKAYESKQYTGDAWVDQSVGYVFFARDFPLLFSCMFDGRNLALERRMLEEHWEFITGLVSGYPGFKCLSREQCRLIRYSRAMFTQGVATSVSKGVGKLLTDNDAIKKYMEEGSRAILEGYQKVRGPGDGKMALLDDEFQPIGGL